VNIRTSINALRKIRRDWGLIWSSIGDEQGGCNAPRPGGIEEAGGCDLDPFSTVRTNGRVIVMSYGAR
jgi:hypothetical protein